MYFTAANTIIHPLKTIWELQLCEISPKAVIKLVSSNAFVFIVQKLNKLCSKTLYCVDINFKTILFNFYCLLINICGGD